MANEPIQKTLREQVGHQMFERVATNPLRWLEMGDSLKRTADLIRAADLCDDGMRYDGKPYPQNSPTGGIDASLLTIDTDIARRYYSMLRVYMFLSGLAIENYAKGIILTKEPSLASSGKIKSWGSKGHGCVQLMNQANMPVSEDESDTLRRLSEYIVWMGRYPTPKEHKDGLVKGGYGSRLPGDFDRIDSICARLRTELAALAESIAIQ